MLNEQFTNYDKDIKNYEKHISGIVDDREDKRSSISNKNPESQTKAQKEQQTVMESIQKISKIIDGYGETMNKNHLIEEIRAYDKSIKE